MPSFTTTAPGKAILFGEHAVVYGSPAIAVPVRQVIVRVTVTPEIQGPAGRVWIEARDIGLDKPLDQIEPGNALVKLVELLKQELGAENFPALRLRINSTIPVAAGLGSGTAVSVAAIRALSAFARHPLPTNRVSELAFEIERIYHGTPSGIDNSVIAYERPIYFKKGSPPELLHIGQPFSLLIADSGIKSTTAKVVQAVRDAHQKDPETYQKMFDFIRDIVEEARREMERGMVNRLGPLMDANHSLLKKMGVSSPELDALVDTAKQAGALGAKLSGGGRGGNIIALILKERAGVVDAILRNAGAKNVIITEVK